MVDAFYFCVGGAVGEYAGIARQIGYRAAAEDCPEAIERLLRGYLKQRSEGENLRSYFRRTSDEDLRAQLAGGVVEPVARDPSPGRVPGNVG
jgi:sulfite reductase (ferredoxin)